MLKILVFLALFATIAYALPNTEVPESIPLDTELTQSFAEARIELDKSGQNACSDLADATEKEVEDNVNAEQGLLNKMDKGQDCPNSGQREVTAAKKAKAKADHAVGHAREAYTAARNKKINFGDFIYSALTEGNCQPFYSSAVWKNAKSNASAARTALERANGAATEAKKGLEAAEKAAREAVRSCRCAVKKAHAGALAKASDKVITANTKAWTKAAHLKCVVAGKTAGQCKVPSLPKLKAVTLANGVAEANCNGVSVGSPLNFNNLCISARDDKPSEPFTLNRDTSVESMVFTHKSGQISCAGNGHLSNFGCSTNLIGLVIADSNNKRILPTSNQKGIQKTSHGHAFWYYVNGVGKNSRSMTWTLEGKTIKKGSYRLWYNEDLTGGTEGDNTGRACYDLTVKPPM